MKKTKQPAKALPAKKAVKKAKAKGRARGVSYAIALLALGVGAAFLPSQASAEVYAEVEAGLTAGTSVEGYNLADDLAFGGFIGTSVGPVRVEGGISRLSADTSGLSVHANDWSGSAYLDFPLTDRTSFSLGGGVDYLQAEATAGPWSVDAEGYGYHVSASLGHRVAENVIVEATGRWLQADLDVADVSVPTFMIGVRFGL